MLNKAEEVRTIATEAAEKWKPGETVVIMEQALDVSLEVIIRIVFGVESKDTVHSFKSHIKEFVNSFHPSLAFTKLFQRPMFGIGPWNKFVANRIKFQKMLLEQIQLRRNNGGNEESILSQLIRSKYEDGSSTDDKAICDQLVSMLLAGHETTQIAIAWAMSWLQRYPNFEQRLLEEFSSDNSIDSILGSELLSGVCNETLRLNAIVPDVVRTLTKPLSWTDVDLPAGTNVSLPICLVHEDSNIYPNPFAFNPDRWNGRTYKPYEYFPFGGGVRRCIGAPLALMELKIVVATWIQQYNFSLPLNAPEIEPVRRRNFTMAPQSGIPLKVIRH